LNVAGYWNGILAALDRAVGERFLAEEHRRMLLVEEEPAALLKLLQCYEPPRVEKWLGREEQL
jgi:predicted Rossmann-fold nucleotide-binding protein